mgnify:CR=1 FL=1
MELKSRNLLGAILLFILLDLSVLAINFWITFRLSNDAVAINLSGRQRMLSQQITKSLLQLQPRLSVEASRAAKEEFRESVRIFDQTLFAFKEGGMAVSSDGGHVALDRVSSVHADQLVKQAAQIWNPMHERMLPYMTAQADIPETVVVQARNQMIQDNRQVLDLMNRLTSSLERDSLNRASALRIVQTAVFILALVNFLVIVRKFHLLTQQSAKTSRHFNELAIRDALTGLFNRRQFENTLQKELAAVDRGHHSNVALVMIDLDGFKAINDQHGHGVGDIVLCTVATRLSDGARLNDTVARVGGDEFMLICPNLHSQENANAFCQRLLDSLKQPIPTDISPMQIGASFGIAFYPDQANSIEALIRMADAAMYATKKIGKTCPFFIPG